MILTLVAEMLAGETILADRGPVDAATAAADDVELWGLWMPQGDEAEREDAELAAVGAGPAEGPVA